MIFSVNSLSKDAMETCRVRIDHLTKPLYSLAQLETMAERLAGILDNPKPSKDTPFAVLVVGGEEATEEEQSFLVYEKFQQIVVPTKAAAKPLEAPVMLLNVGNEQMDASIVEEYIETGRSIAEQLYEQGIRVIGLGNIPSKAEEECFGLLDTLGEGGLSLEAWTAKLGETTPLLVTLVGVVLGAAELRMGVFFDNEVTGLAAVLAVAYVPMVKEYLYTSVNYGTEVQAKELQYLGKEAPLHFGLTWAAGLGSTLGLSTLRAALYMLNDMKTFEEAGVAIAEDGPGSSAQK